VTFWGEGAPLSAVLTLLYLYYPVLDTLMEVGSGLVLPGGLKVWQLESIEPILSLEIDKMWYICLEIQIFKI